MELSELVDFGGMLLTMDDRTGLSVLLLNPYSRLILSYEALNCLAILTGHAPR